MREPTYSFTLPSLHDELPLDCRIYEPLSLSSREDTRGAILAHPYAPLGGCYDDHVVLSLAETLLARGYYVSTFNFRRNRGAGTSQGRTSLSGRAEIDDYMTIAGFMLHFLHQLNTSTGRPMRLVLGGYSYGSLVLARLPALSAIHSRFEEAMLGSSVAEVILRARTLAQKCVASKQLARDRADSRGRTLKPESAASSPTKHHTPASPITMGGDESDASTRRRSRDSRRSGDFIRRSAELPHRVMAIIRHDKEDREDSGTVPTPHTGAGFSLPEVKLCYLVISPVLLPFTVTLCPPGPAGLGGMFRRSSPDDDAAGAVLLQHPSLAVFGTSDTFTSSKRLLAWAEKQAQIATTGCFRWRQVEGAGHFWIEEGVMERLQDEVARWIESPG